MNKVKCILPLLSLLLPGLLSSCLKDSGSFGDETEEAQIVLSALTRGGTDDPDDPDGRIGNFRVMIFRAGGALAYNHTFDLSAENPFTITIMTGVYDFAFVGNEDSDTELRSGKTLTQILDGFGGRTIDDIYGIHFSSSAFRNDLMIPRTGIYRGVTVNADNTVTLAGKSTAEPNPWSAGVERLGIRVDLTLRAVSQTDALNFSALKITHIPDKVWFFAADGSGTPVYNDGSYESASPVPPYRTFAADSGDEYEVVSGVEYFTAAGYPVSFEEDSANPGTYLWHKRLILPSSTFTPAADESKAIVFQAVVNGRPCQGTLGTGLLGYNASRNHRYRLTGELKADQPIAFTVDVTNWSADNRIPLPWLAP